MNMNQLHCKTGSEPHNQAQIIDEDGQTVAITYNDKDGKKARMMAKAPQMADFMRWLIDKVETNPSEENEPFLRLIRQQAANILNS